MTRVLIVGASLGALRTAEALRDQGFGASITIVGAEPHLPYDRPPLSKTVMTGASRLEGTALPLRRDLEVDWRLGRTAVSLDLQRRLVALADGVELPFDGLVLATGARARIPGSWAGVCGVHVLRGLDDARELRAALRDRPRRVAVLGAGFIGSEIAASIRALDVPVTLLDAATLPLEAAVGEQVAQYVAVQHRAHGVDLRTESRVAELELRNGALVGLRLADGTLIDADLAVVGFGVTPNTEWLEDSGLVLGDGIVCDAQLRTRTGAGPLPGVVAVADVARWPHPLAAGATVRIEHWSNAMTHGALAAHTLLHDLGVETTHSPARDIVPSFWTDLYATKILAVGLPALATASTVLSGSFEDGHGVVGYGRDGRLVGAVAINDPRSLAPYRRLLAAGSAWPPEPTTGANAPATSRSNEPRHYAEEQS
ncbi:NAD(P)/FAD-dependent oxidoreductase [Nocardioides kribbensis]|uniref:FAD/NAD(P)-binding oxidoreductase n=1 Tax=Nocardioides kribbensis TaxID=305517 RepID=A0ABV1NTA8_9ACTN